MRMKNIFAISFLLLWAAEAYATISPSYPYTLQNGTTADASQVMANFDQVQGDVNTYAAPLASPAFTGVPTAPTAASGTNTTQLATMAAVKAATAPIATDSVAGIVIPDGTVITVSGTGAITVPDATSSALGVVQPDGTIITVSSGAITVAKASASGFGVVEVDNSTIKASSGVISCTTGTSSQLGCLKPDGTTITASAGALTAVTVIPSAGAVGSSILALVPTGHSAGFQISGASITPCTGAGSATGDTVSGTWQYSNSNNSGGNQVMLVTRVS